MLENLALRSRRILRKMCLKRNNLFPCAFNCRYFDFFARKIVSLCERRSSHDRFDLFCTQSKLAKQYLNLRISFEPPNLPFVAVTDAVIEAYLHTEFLLLI